MKKLTNIIYIAALCGALLTSCTKDNSAGEGALSLKLEFNQASKAAMTTEELTASAIVNIYKADFSGLVRSYRYSEMPAEILLPQDKYRIDVLAGELSKDNPSSVSWDQRSYKGSSEVSIYHSNKVSAIVTASVYNVTTRVNFDASLGQNLQNGYCLSFRTQEDTASETIDYTADKNGIDACFLVDEIDPVLYWDFSGVRSRNGENIHTQGVIKDLKKGHLYTIKPKFTAKDGDLTIDFEIDESIDIVDGVIIFNPIGLIETPEYETWATKTSMYASVDESAYPELPLVEFIYSTDLNSPHDEWQHIEAYRETENQYSKTVTGLEPESTYYYFVCVNGETLGENMTFTTEAAPQLPNNSFEVYSNAEANNYKSFYDPNDATWNTKWWDSGNRAAAAGGMVISGISTTDFKDGNASAYLSSDSMIGNLAAGNLFVGEFYSYVMLPPSGRVNFGRYWNARPSALRFWIKYHGGKINVGSSGGAVDRDNGDYDVASIHIALGTWPASKYGGSAESPVQVNTGNKNTFWDYPNLPETIAFGRYDESADSEFQGQWHQVTLPLDYSNLEAKPTHIIVSCAANKYGDYFMGYDKAEVWLDKFELLYE